MRSTTSRLPAEAFAKVDPSNDDLFYAVPRMVTHIDDDAIRALKQLYETILPPGGAILDLMSSRFSHIPASCAGSVTGHGMNAAELAANPQLDDIFVQNLNENPLLPLQDASFDAAVCCAGVQYLCHPIDVFSEVRRVLREGAPFIVSFSNRCFPTKAVAIWRALSAQDHAKLVEHYAEQAGFERSKCHILCDGKVGDPLTAVVGYR
jgi:Methyltransferase domain